MKLWKVQKVLKLHRLAKAYRKVGRRNKKRKKRGVGQNDGVVLSTMHGAKGLEFEAVCIAGAVDGIIPHYKSQGISGLEEERRLFYVAMTRAKNI